MPFQPPFFVRPRFCDFGVHSGSTFASAIEDLLCGDFGFVFPSPSPPGGGFSPRQEPLPDCGPDLVRDPNTGECVLRVPVQGRVPRGTNGADLRRFFMPFNPFLPGGGSTGRFGPLLDLGVDVGRRLLQGRTQTSVGFPGTGMPTTTFPERMLGQVIQKGCGCVIEKQMPAHVRRVKGRAVFGPDGSFLGCTPKRRAINPMNGRAATRAARRLTSVMRFQKKIQKAVRRACGSKGGGFRRAPAKRSCK